MCARPSLHCPHLLDIPQIAGRIVRQKIEAALIGIKYPRGTVEHFASYGLTWQAHAHARAPFQHRSHPIRTAANRPVGWPSTWHARRVSRVGRNPLLQRGHTRHRPEGLIVGESQRPGILAASAVQRSAPITNYDIDHHPSVCSRIDFIPRVGARAADG